MQAYQRLKASVLMICQNRRADIDTRTALSLESTDLARNVATMDYKDYYKLLGVPKNADADTIKKAYRKLARQYHPDMNPDPKAEARFKEINEANEVLSDPQKRAKYDQLGHSYQQWQRTGGQPSGFDWSQWVSGAPGQGGIRYEYSGTGDVFSEFFQSIFGGSPFGGMGGTGRRRTDDILRGASRPGRGRGMGRDLSTEVEITLEEAYHGTTRLISKDGRRLQVRIPRGARTGTKVRLTGEGASGIGPSGDLYLRVTVKGDPNFQREGDDLHETVLINLYTVVLGGEVQIPTLTGKVTLKISPGTQPGQLIRVRGKGMPKLRQPDTTGDLYVRIDVEIPAELSAKERALFKELANIHGLDD